jgi:CheY-like chemotaxis protein
MTFLAASHLKKTGHSVQVTRGVEVSMRKIVLSVGTNHSLLGLRNKVLAQAGYLIVPAKSGAAALKLMQSQPLDAVILGHSLSSSLKLKLLQAAKCEFLPAIVLHAYAYEADLSDAYANLCGIDGAARILDVLSDLFSAAEMRLAKTVSQEPNVEVSARVE